MDSALDAYIRHLQVAVPRDAVAHIHEHLADASLELMTRNMDADVCTADDGSETSGRDRDVTRHD